MRLMSVSHFKSGICLSIFLNLLEVHLYALQKRNSSSMTFTTIFEPQITNESASYPTSEKIRLPREASSSNLQNEELTRLSGDFYLPKNYTRIHAPNHEYSGAPLEVTLEIHDLDITDVNDIDYTMTLKMFLGVRWEDERIIHRGSSDKDTQIPLDLILTKMLWSPDIDIYNLKEVEDFEVMKKTLAGKLEIYSYEKHCVQSNSNI